MRSKRIQSFAILAVILLIVGFSFSPTLKNDFVSWDDEVHLLDNLSVRSLDKENLRDIFDIHKKINDIYIPLSTLSFAVEYHFVKYAPFLYHLDNLILYGLILIGIYFLARQLGLSVGGAGAATLLFGVHPMHVESVAWITERKDMLYGFFYLLSLNFYLKYLQQFFTVKKKNVVVKTHYGYFILTLLTGILSMLAKPMAFSLPLIVFLLDWIKRRKIDRKVITEKIILLFVIVSLAMITYMVHARPVGRSLTEAPLIWIWTFVFYIKRFFVPTYFVPLYQLPKPIGIMQPEYALAVIIFIISLASILYFRKYRWYLFAWLFYFLSVFPVLRYDDLTDTSIVADRMMFLPSLGFCILLGWGVQKALQQNKKFALKSAVLCLLAGSIIFLSYKTYLQSQVWKNKFSLWQYQIKYKPQQAVAYNNLAAVINNQEDYKVAEEEYRKIVELQKNGLGDEDLSTQAQEYKKKVDQVISLYEKAIQNNPDYTDALFNLGDLYRRIGKIPEAIRYFEKVLQLDPTYKEIYFGLGDLFRQIGRHKEAVDAYNKIIDIYPSDKEIYVNLILSYNKALTQEPGNVLYLEARKKMLYLLSRLIHSKPARARSFFNLGILYYESNEPQMALMAYQKALEIDPDNIDTLFNLGNLYKETGQTNKALKLYEQVISLDPRRGDAYINVGTIYTNLSEPIKAKTYFQKAIEKDPENPKGYFNLGYMAEAAGNLNEALRLYQKTITLDKENAEAYYNIGNIFVRLKRNADAFKAYRSAVAIKKDHMNALVNLSILSFQEGRYEDAVSYCDAAVLYGYDAPEEYLKTLEEYREK